MGRLLGTLIVIVLKARNLPNKQRIGKQDVFSTVIYRGQRNKTQIVKKGGQHPHFDEEFRYEIRDDVDEEVHAEITSTGGVKPTTDPKAKEINKGRIIKVAVYSDDPRDPDLIGDATVDFSQTMVAGEFDEWVQILDVQQKYAGEIFLEMTYYDQTRKSAKARPAPTDGSYGGPGEFEAMPSPGKVSSIGRTGRPTSLQPGTPNRLQHSVSQAQLSIGGSDAYTPNYAPSSLVPPGRGPSPAPSANRPSRHNSLNDHDIASLSTSLSAMSVRKPLPLPGTSPSPVTSPPRLNPSALPASFHQHRHSMPTFEPIASPGSPLRQHSPMPPSHTPLPEPENTPWHSHSEPPSINGWRRQVMQADAGSSYTPPLQQQPISPTSQRPAASSWPVPPVAAARPLPAPAPAAPPYPPVEQQAMRAPQGFTPYGQDIPSYPLTTSPSFHHTPSPSQPTYSPHPAAPQQVQYPAGYPGAPSSQYTSYAPSPPTAHYMPGSAPQPSYAASPMPPQGPSEPPRSAPPAGYVPGPPPPHLRQQVRPALPQAQSQPQMPTYAAAPVQQQAHQQLPYDQRAPSYSVETGYQNGASLGPPWQNQQASSAYRAPSPQPPYHAPSPQPGHGAPPAQQPYRAPSPLPPPSQQGYMSPPAAQAPMRSPSPVASYPPPQPAYHQAPSPSLPGAYNSPSMQHSLSNQSAPSPSYSQPSYPPQHSYAPQSTNSYPPPPQAASYAATPPRHSSYGGPSAPQPYTSNTYAEPRREEATVLRPLPVRPEASQPSYGNEGGYQQASYGQPNEAPAYQGQQQQTWTGPPPPMGYVAQAPVQEQQQQVYYYEPPRRG